MHACVASAVQEGNVRRKAHRTRRARGQSMLFEQFVGRTTNDGGRQSVALRRWLSRRAARVCARVRRLGCCLG